MKKKIAVVIIAVVLMGSVFTGSAKAQTLNGGMFNIQSADNAQMSRLISLLMQLVALLQERLAQVQAQQAHTDAIVSALASSTPGIATTTPALPPIQAPVVSNGGSSVVTPEVVAPAQTEPIMPIDNFDQYKPVITLSSSAQSGNVGDKVTLHWVVTAEGATRFDCSGSGDWGGEKDAVGSQEVELTKQGVMSFTLYCKALPGNYANSVTITVQVN